MSRITLYNSTAILLSSERPVADVDRWPAALTDATSEEDSGRTAAVRLIGIDQDVRFVSYEIYMEFSDPDDIVKLRWFQEFYSDWSSAFASPVISPETVKRPGTGYSAGAAPWMRETDLIDGGLGNVDMHPVTRRMTLVPVKFGPPAATKPQVSLHVPLSVHASWARIAFWIDFGASNITDTDGINLYITAHAGGHTEFEYLQRTSPDAYVYDAYTNRPLPLGAKVIKVGQ